MISTAHLARIPRPNWIEINLDALVDNIRLIRSRVPAGTKILLPVKADAYGHGSLAVSWAAIHAGVDFLGVAHLFEGILLRQYGIRKPILVLGPCVPAEFNLLLTYQLTPTIANLETALAFDSYLQSENAILDGHLKIDSGMHRFGIPPEQLTVIRQILDLKNLNISGMYSHLATADVPGHPSTEKQIRRFSLLVQTLESENRKPAICHLGNSAATLTRTHEAHFDMVRPGLALYGYNPMGSYPAPWPLQPVLSMRATVRTLHEVPVGEGVSYGHYWIAQQPTKVAAVAIGYGDGYPRGEYNKGVVFIKGQACPILGRVCMDATMVDVSALPQVQVGDVVECINGLVDPRISMETLATDHNTIAYELTTRVARRLYRLYQWKGKTLRWDDAKIELGVPEFCEFPHLDSERP